MSINLVQEGEIWIPIIPVAKGRPRFSNGHAFTPKKTRDAEKFIRDYVFFHHMIPHPLDGPLALSIRFFFKKVVNNTKYHTKRPDIDNLAKLVLDSLGPHVYTYLGVKTLAEGILFSDDCQVVSLMADKYYHEKQGIWIRWRVLPEEFTVVHPLER